MSLKLLASLSLLATSLVFIQAPSANAATTYSFTTASATGRLGPTQAQITTAYTGTSLAGLVTINTRGIQEWTVPSSGKYRIVAAGAAGAKGNGGSTNSGKGVVQTIDVNLTSGSTLRIVVGQVGIVGTYVSGGGGGSFVFSNISDTYPITAAGGGGAGGYSSSSYPTGIDASTSQSGTNGNTQSSGGGSSGNGGSIPSGATSYGGGGAGWVSDGSAANDKGCGTTPVAAAAVKNGATGGSTNGPNGGDGGFGGGGASGVECGASGAGGGGGYSGGGPGTSAGLYGGGGGGGSYYTPSATFVSASATNTGAGYVTITSLGPSIVTFAPQSTITNSTSMNYDLVFSEAVTGLATSDFGIGGTGGSTCGIAISGSGSIYVVSLTSCSVGTVTLYIVTNAVQNAVPQYAPSADTYAPSLVIDQTAPTISTVSAPANGTYKPSDTPTFTIAFSESVTITGTPRLTLDVGGLTKYANYVSMTDSKTALFRYTVSSSVGEFDTNGIGVNAFLDINSGTIRDLATNDLAIYTFTAPTLTSVLVAQKASAPTITSITPGSSQLTVNFSAGSSNGAAITNYKYSLNGGAFTAFSPVDTVTPLVITGLTNGTAYAVRILAVNLVGDGDSSTAVTETPSAITVTGDSTIVLTYGTSGSTGNYSASGGTNTFTWSLGSVISGVTLSGTSVAVANTLNAGTYNQTVRATDGASAVGSKQLTITINKASSSLSIALQRGGTSSPVGESPVISITTDQAGTVAFSLGGFSISACAAVSVASTTGTCTLPTPGSTGSLSLLAIFTPTSGNYETSSATITITIVDGVSTISISLAGGVTQTPKGKAVVVTATIDKAGKVTFFADGKRIPGCFNLSASAGTKTCNWTPTVQKQVYLSAALTPTNSVYKNSSSGMVISVTRRTGTR
jgi:hypothetical protein